MHMKCFQNLKTFSYEKGTNISLHISKLENLASRLKALEQDITDSMLVSKILSTLPEQFRHFCTAWESTPVMDRTMENLISRLVSEEAKMKKQNEEDEKVDFRVVEKRRSYDRGSPSSGKNTGESKVCFKCGQPGHFAFAKRQTMLRKTVFSEIKTRKNKGRRKWHLFLNK